MHACVFLSLSWAQGAWIFAEKRGGGGKKAKKEKKKIAMKTF